MKKKKICFVVSSPITATAFLVNHIKVLSDFYDVYLVANFDTVNPDVFKELPLKEIKHITILRNINLFSDTKTLFALRKYFKEKQFDVVHTVTPKAGLLGILGARLAGIKNRIHIFTGQVWHTKKGAFKRLLMFIDKFIVWNATDILVDGESQRLFLIANHIVEKDKSFVLGKGSISGVDTNKFVPDFEVRNAIRNQIGFEPDEVVYTFLGRMNIDKGMGELAVAFDKLSQKYDKARLLLIGIDEENIEALMKKTVKNNEKVFFYGMTPSPEKVLQAGDVFCLPSYREGFGTSVIEASLLEKPVICSDTYGLMETIIDNETGLRHKVADAESLFSQMEILVNNENMRQQLGKKGRAYVLENFSAQQISEKWLEFYRNKI
jgi:glycosyltransferase involved in cell wall biosynthesis